MRYVRQILLSMIVALLSCQALPAFAMATPEAVNSLSSAGTAVGQPILDSSGQPVIDAAGHPLTVLSIQTDPAQATAFSLASTLKMPVGDLLAQATSLGISIPLMAAGTMTTVTRSDGGIERIFAFTTASGDTCVFLADQTGPNVYGVRIANVHANGIGTVFTAHGLNGNFLSPPWYLSSLAKQNYWTNTQTAQVFTLPPPNPTVIPPSGSSSMMAKGHGEICFTSDFARGNARVSLSGNRKRQLMVASNRAHP